MNSVSTHVGNTAHTVNHSFVGWKNSLR